MSTVADELHCIFDEFIVKGCGVSFDVYDILVTFDILALCTFLIILNEFYI